MNSEFTPLRTEINRIATNTEWNGTAVLSGTGPGLTAGTAIFQVGANATQTVSVTIGNFGTGTGALLADINASTLATQADSASAITALDTSIAAVNTGRAGYGAVISRLEFAADNLANVSANATESRSRVLDADYAKETTELARTQIIAQAGTAMLAQANQAKQTVLSLLK
jgi:flagellin